MFTICLIPYSQHGLQHNLWTALQGDIRSSQHTTICFLLASQQEILSPGSPSAYLKRDVLQRTKHKLNTRIKLKSSSRQSLLTPTKRQEIHVHIQKCFRERKCVWKPEWKNIRICILERWEPWQSMTFQKGNTEPTFTSRWMMLLSWQYRSASRICLM